MTKKQATPEIETTSPRGQPVICIERHGGKWWIVVRDSYGHLCQFRRRSYSTEMLACRAWAAEVGH